MSGNRILRCITPSLTTTLFDVPHSTNSFNTAMNKEQPQYQDPLLNPGQLRQIVKNLPSKIKVWDNATLVHLYTHRNSTYNSIRTQTTSIEMQAPCWTRLTSFSVMRKARTSLGVIAVTLMMNSAKVSFLL